jgi:M6 family metalloprotease-like protein
MKPIRYCLALLFIAGLSALGAEKMILGKEINSRPPKAHPYINLLNKQDHQASDFRKDATYQRLLVILVDFQEEVTDDPLTTGNGKFQLEEDPDYLYSIASPPHDREYFLANMEAMRYYYLAVSNGSYDLQYDVYPTDGGSYTLPHSMGYYNPPNATSAQFVAGMEEYFRQSFEIADQQDPSIDFSSYGHYMIIHAGSDWQHDINGDTPSDIPSFFIRVSEGKEAVVDGGATLISHACNVPGTISQDFSTSDSSAGTIHSGYGALNAVLAHEFGHSVGLVDLYNVYTFQPMVGMFDIMDSGGSGVLVDQLQDGSLIMIEGILPALPGAYSRMLLFGDHYLSSGYLLHADLNAMNSPLELAASSMKQTGTIKPHTLKIPLSDKEYLLVENRSVDPDNDGGTAVFGTLDGRVILHPTPIDDPANNPSYEYDYLLPSFQTSSGAAVGGGILVWHVNEDVIHDQGVTQSDGTWVSNFDNNTVNTQYFDRGVKVIEADGLQDIGYNWSWYWAGTQYEYFHKTRPILDSNGFFVNWSMSPWKPELSSVTVPAILDRNGAGSQYSIADIGNPGAVMSLTLNDNFFTARQIFAEGNAHSVIAPMINTSFSDATIPLIGNGSVILLSWDGDSWIDQMGAFAFNGVLPDKPVVTADQKPDGYQELILCKANKLDIIDFANDTLNQSTITASGNFTCAPLPFSEALYAASRNELLKIRNNAIEGSLPITGIKELSAHAQEIMVLADRHLYFVSRDDLSILLHVPLPEEFGDYRPVTFTGDGEAITYLMANSGNIYSYRAANLRGIYTNNLASLPTQMGITSFGGESPVLFFGTGSRVHALSIDGSNLPGYPRNVSPLSFSPKAEVYSLSMDREMIYLPIQGKGHAAFAFGSGPLWDRSLLSAYPITGSQMYWNDISGRLDWFRDTQNGSVAINGVSLAENPITWNGFRNGDTGNWNGNIIHAPAQTQAFNAYVYPNPVRGSEYRLRVENSTADITVQIFDINGTMVDKSQHSFDQQSNRDIRLNSDLASGVYLLTVKSGNARKTVKFAVEK